MIQKENIIFFYYLLSMRLNYTSSWNENQKVQKNCLHLLIGWKTNRGQCCVLKQTQVYLCKYKQRHLFADRPDKKIILRNLTLLCMKEFFTPEEIEIYELVKPGLSTGSTAQSSSWTNWFIKSNLLNLEINWVQLFSFMTIYRQSLLKDVQRGLPLKKTILN